MPDALKLAAAELTPQIEAALCDYAPLSTRPGASDMNEAVHYALFGGGKRMRPLVALLAARIAGCRQEHGLRAACALEYLHTASLIFDDLPCMDDAHVRRGRETAHARFGEGVATLAALALLNRTYELFAAMPNGAALVREAGRAIGEEGMIAGQVIDLRRAASSRRDHYLKTTTLFRLSLTAGAIATGSMHVHALGRYGHCLGMAYQLIDDAGDLAEDGSFADSGPLLSEAERWIRIARRALRLIECPERSALDAFAARMAAQVPSMQEAS